MKVSCGDRTLMADGWWSHDATQAGGKDRKGRAPVERCLASEAALHGLLGGDVSQKIIEYLGSERLVVGIAADQVPLVKAFVDRIVGNTFAIA